MWIRRPQQVNYEEDFRFDVKTYENSFLRAIKPAICIAQCFGLFPINIRLSNPLEIHFKWKSLRTIFSMCTILTSFVTMCFILAFQSSLGPLTARNVIGIVFFFSCFVIAVLFFKITRNLRMLFVCWMKTENIFITRDYEKPKNKWSLRKRIFVFMTIYLLLAFLEHLLFLAAELNSIINRNNETNPVEAFLLGNFNFITDRLPIPNTLYLGVLLEYLNFSYTFYWNFLNLFIILIAMGLSFLYENVYWRSEAFRGLIIDEAIWSEIRTHHWKVSELTKLLNTYLSEMITVACFNDSYFLLNQMANILVSPYIINQVYFWYSALFLMFRLSATIIMTSLISESSRKPMRVFRSIPSECWGEELQRFFNQIKAGSNSFSGSGLFFIRRQMLLNVAGTLVIYELVLMHFKS